MQGLRQIGKTLQVDLGDREFLANAQTKKYLGFYRYNNRLIFSYAVDGVEYLDAPQLVNGKFVSVALPRGKHPDRDHLQGGKPQWPQTMDVQGQLGKTAPMLSTRFHCQVITHGKRWFMEVDMIFCQMVPQSSAPCRVMFGVQQAWMDFLRKSVGAGSPQGYFNHLALLCMKIRFLSWVEIN